MNEKIILLVRHGKTNAAPSTICNYTEFYKQSQAYELSELDVNSSPGEGLKTAVSSLSNPMWIASAKKRAQQSLEVISGKKDYTILPELNEFSLPVTPLPFIKLSTIQWGNLAGKLRTLGYSYGTESRKQREQRCKLVAEKILEVSKNSNHVAVVAHGLMNIMLSQELLNRGFNVAEEEGEWNYWAWAKFQIK